MNLGYATFFIRIMIVCGEFSASKLRSKQYPVKISSSKKSDRFDQKNPEQLLMHWITGLASNTYLSWTMKRAFQNYWNRRRSEERGVVTNLQWQTYQYVRGGRPGDASSEEEQKLTDRRKPHIQWFTGVGRRALTPAEWRSAEDQQGVWETRVNRQRSLHVVRCTQPDNGIKLIVKNLDDLDQSTVPLNLQLWSAWQSMIPQIRMSSLQDICSYIEKLGHSSINVNKFQKHLVLFEESTIGKTNCLSTKNGSYIPPLLNLQRLRSWTPKAVSKSALKQCLELVIWSNAIFWEGPLLFVVGYGQLSLNSKENNLNCWVAYIVSNSFYVWEKFHLMYFE